MNKGLILSIIAGFTTMFGMIFTINFKNRKNIEKIITISLSMAFITMILISIFDLAIESINNLSKTPFLSVLSYVFINYIILYLIIKISHTHKKKKQVGELYFLGIINMITLLIHNIPEGVITCITTNYNLNLGIKITSSIIIHNIPEGISIAVPIYYETKSRIKTFIYVLIAALGEPIGALFSFFFINNRVNNKMIGYMLISITILMICISVEEIFPQIRSKNKKSIIIGLIIGLLIFIINRIL